MVNKDFNFAPPSDEPVFTVYWRGRKDKNCSGFWHTPNVMDGGYIVAYKVYNSECTISYYSDNFWGDEPLEEKKFHINKCTSYDIYIKDGHIVVPGVELETIWDEEKAKEARIKREKEEEEYRLAHPEEYVDLGNGQYVKKFRIIKTNNPTTICDKIFMGFPKPTNTDVVFI